MLSFTCNSFFCFSCHPFMLKYGQVILYWWVFFFNLNTFKVTVFENWHLNMFYAEIITFV